MQWQELQLQIYKQLILSHNYREKPAYLIVIMIIDYLKFQGWETKIA